MEEELDGTKLPGTRPEEASFSVFAFAAAILAALARRTSSEGFVVPKDERLLERVAARGEPLPEASEKEEKSVLFASIAVGRVKR